MLRILIVEPEPVIAEAVGTLVQGWEVDPVRAGSLAEARKVLDEGTCDLVFLELNLPDGSGVDLLRDLGDVDADVVIVAEEATAESAVLALRQGASDYLTHPLDASRLGRILAAARKSSALKSRISEMSRDLRSLGRFDRMVGGSPRMQDMYDLIERVAPTEASVFITGETGTGKEMVARAVHRLSKRTEESFVPVNCGAVPANLMESELFGHEEGGFTGADRRHQGMVEQAHRGTLFLDEITEMHTDLQVKLLRVLETGQVRRVGGDRTIEVDVRVICATNREPQEAISEDKLREDLFYRLAVFPIHLPPLRERPGDVRRLAEHFLDALNREHGATKSIPPHTLKILETHAWPGNVRELRNTLERAYILAEQEITPGCIRFEGSRPGVEPAAHQSATAGSTSPSNRPGGTGLLSLKEVERRQILRVLQDLDQDKKAAAKVLGISLKTLYNRLKAYREAGLDD